METYNAISTTSIYATRDRISVKHLERWIYECKTIHTSYMTIHLMKRCIVLRC